MEKVKLVASLALCCLPVWGLSALGGYALQSFLDQGRISPRHLTVWGAAGEAFPGFLGLVFFVSWFTLRAQRRKL